MNNDLTQTVQHLEKQIAQLNLLLPKAEESSEYETFMKKLRRRQKWSEPLVWVAAAISVAFSVGVYWAVFMGANATDGDVAEALARTMKAHNGIDPDAIDPETRQPYGSHPDLRKSLKDTSQTASTNKQSLEKVDLDLCKLDKRSQYQFEFSRWQALVMEAERKRQPRPGKPPELQNLETELMMGNYTDCPNK